MAEVNLIIAGRSYQVGCRPGEEENLLAAARMVDAKSREALAGLGSLSEARQLLFASLLIADQMVDQRKADPSQPDPLLAARAERLVDRLEALADTLEREGESA